MEEEEPEQSDTNPVLDTRLLFDDEETDHQAGITNSLLDARILLNDEI